MVKNKIVFDKSPITWILRVIIWTIVLNMLFFSDFIRRLFIGMVVLVISCILIEIYDKKVSIYHRFGRLCKWYEQTMKFMGIDWIKRVYNEILNKNLLRKECSDVVFVSPSANKGIYEKELFKYLSNQQSKHTFIISDIENIHDHEENMDIGSNRYIYLPKRDARYISDTLIKCGQEKADVVWDFKGFIWYSIKSGKTKNVIEAFETYKNTLSDEGIIILDNIIVSKWHYLLWLVYILTGIQLSYLENSSIEMLDKFIKNKKHLKLKEFLEDNFESFEISDTEKKLNINVRIYRKKMQ